MRRALIPLAIVLVMIAAAAGCSFQIGEVPPSPEARTLLQQEPPLPPGASVERVVERVLPAVVNIRTDMFGLEGSGRQGIGTGFIVDADGTVVTNCHVVQGGSKVTVLTSDEEPDSYDARVIGGDCLRDLAVLDIDAENLPTVPLGKSSLLNLGQDVVALGYALALEGGPTVTQGIVSSLDRTIQARDPGCANCPDGVRTYSEVIQTDAAINQGNSGGPLVNMRGEVVGINSAGNDQAQNIGFAIAIDSVREAIEHAMTDPLAPSAYLGVTTQAVTPALVAQLDLGVQEGVYVVDTAQDGPASGAGIHEGDVIVAVDGRSVTSPEELGRILADFSPGDRVTVDLAEGSERRSVEVELGTRPMPAELP